MFFQCEDIYHFAMKKIIEKSTPYPLIFRHQIVQSLKMPAAQRRWIEIYWVSALCHKLAMA